MRPGNLELDNNLQNRIPERLKDLKQRPIKREEKNEEDNII